MPRAYLSNQHLQTVIETEAGRIAICPQEADRITFDIASANSMPANLPGSAYNGSSVLDIGRGVQIRASGFAKLVGIYQGEPQWAVESTLHARQYPSGRDLTAQQQDRARAIIGEAITQWARAHASDIAQADDIYRNNGAHTLEEAIDKHEAALAILRGQLNACINGEPFTQYPDLPTKGR